MLSRRLGRARGGRRCGRVSALKRRVPGWQGGHTPAWKSVAAPDKRRKPRCAERRGLCTAEEASPDRLCTGYCPMDRRRLWPFWGPQILQMVVSLAVRSVTVLGVWLRVTRTQALPFAERDCTDPCHRLPSGAAGSRLFASDVQVLLLPHVLISTLLRVGCVLTSSSSCHLSNPGMIAPIEVTCALP